MKVMISGVSGSGKTKLAKHLAKEYDVPFISGSSKVLWPEYGITTHAELIQRMANDVEFGLSFQYELIGHRKRIFNEHPDWFSDRGTLDNIVYTVSQLSDKLTNREMLDFIKTAIDSIPKGAYTILLEQPIYYEDDGYRVTNKEYQNMINLLFTHYATVLPLRVMYANHYLWSERIKEAYNIISKNV